MRTTLNRYTLFTTLTLLTLGGFQLPAVAVSDSTIPSARQEATSASFYAQGTMQSAQAEINCRKVKDGGTVLANNSSGTGGGEVLPQGTFVEITKNVSGNFIQVDKVNGKPKVGFVSKLSLAPCTVIGKTPTAACYKVRNLREIVNMGGLPIRQTPSPNSAEAFRRLAVGEIFRGANPPEKLDSNGLKWVKTASVDGGPPGYVSDGPSNSSVRNLEPVSCK